MKLSFSPANRKLIALEKLTGRKVFSFSLLSGWNCPQANLCQSFAVETPAGVRIRDGKHNKFRCFSASNEVLFPAVYASRKANGDILKVAALSTKQAATLLLAAMPKKAGIIRIHVGGDFKTQAYFDTWLRVAEQRPDVWFYAYTKSIAFWLKRIAVLPENLIMTASIGGRQDELAVANNLRSATVFETESHNVDNIPVDHTDEYAALPINRDVNFGLLEHGPQKGRRAKYGYGKMKGAAT